MKSKTKNRATKIFAAIVLFPLLNSPSWAEQDCNAPNGEYGSFLMQPDNDGHLAITVSIGDKPRLMIVDTGGSSSMLSSASVKEMNLTPRAAAGVREISARGGVTRDFVNAPTFTIGRVRLDGQQFAVWPDEDPMLSHSNAEGLLGPDVLSKFDVDFDFRNYAIKLFRSDHCAGRIPYWSETYASLPFKLDYNDHVIVGMTLDGKPLQVMIDTGAPRTTMTTAVAGQMFGLNPQSPGMKQVGSFPSASRKAQPYYEYRFSTLSMDGLTVKNPLVAIVPDEISPEIPSRSLPYDMILGLADIAALHMYIAYGEQTLYFTGKDARAMPAASAQNSSQPTAAQKDSNTKSTPIAVKEEYAADYPPDAAAKGEEGVALVAILKENGQPTAKLGQSSGYADLDEASVKLAVPYFLSGATAGVNLIAVRWALGPDRPASFALGQAPKPQEPVPAKAPYVSK